MKALKILGVLVSLILTIAIPSWGGSNFTVYVPPSGGDDTGNLQAALDDCMLNHPTGCTIQLSAGTYKSQQLFIEDFHGTLKGMGMDATIIQVLPLDDVTSETVGEGYFDINPPSRSNKYPFLLIFMAGDITVSDLTFKVIEHDPVTPWCYSGLGCGQTYLMGFLGVIGTSANLLVARVGFEGGPGPLPTGRNYDDGPFFSGLSMNQPLTGTFKLVSSHFKNGEDCLVVWAVRNAQITIGGSPSDGNVFEPGALAGAYIDLDHSAFEFSYNNVDIYPWAGLYVVQADYLEKPSRFLIQHNTFKATGSWVDGIAAVDYGPFSGWGKTADFVIRDNTIQIAGSEVDPAWAGIEAAYLDGAVISNNRILGSSTYYGIALEGTSKCMVKWNNVRRLAVTAEGAAIYLDADTSYCTVIGADLNDTVMDQGTDNKLINVDVKPFRWFDRDSHNCMRDKLELRKHRRATWSR